MREEDMVIPPGYTGPFSDGHDCPVHNPSKDLAPSAPEAPTAEAARGSPQQKEHTPGPWRVFGGTSPVFAFDVYGPKGEDIGYANPSDGADDPQIYPAAANARLMAAAPDLLDALKAHDAYMSVNYADGPNSKAMHPRAAENWRRIQAAIAKAEGR